MGPVSRKVSRDLCLKKFLMLGMKSVNSGVGLLARHERTFSWARRVDLYEIVVFGSDFVKVRRKREMTRQARSRDGERVSGTTEQKFRTALGGLRVVLESIAKKRKGSTTTTTASNLRLLEMERDWLLGDFDAFKVGFWNFLQKHCDKLRESISEEGHLVEFNDAVQLFLKTAEADIAKMKPGHGVLDVVTKMFEFLMEQGSGVLGSLGASETLKFFNDFDLSQDARNLFVAGYFLKDSDRMMMLNKHDVRGCVTPEIRQWVTSPLKSSSWEEHDYRRFLALDLEVYRMVFCEAVCMLIFDSSLPIPECLEIESTGIHSLRVAFKVVHQIMAVVDYLTGGTMSFDDIGGDFGRKIMDFAASSFFSFEEGVKEHFAGLGPQMSECVLDAFRVVTASPGYQAKWASSNGYVANAFRFCISSVREDKVPKDFAVVLSTCSGFYQDVLLHGRNAIQLNWQVFHPLFYVEPIFDVIYQSDVVKAAQTLSSFKTPPLPTMSHRVAIDALVN